MARDISHLGQVTMWVLWIETLVALLFVGLRLYTRHVLVKNVGLDDHLTWISLILFILYSTFITVGVTWGYGQHAADIKAPQSASNAVFYVLLGQVCNISAIFTTKSSVAVFLLRLVRKTLHRVILHFAIWSTAVVCASCIILMYLQCSPVQYIWDPSTPGAVCYFTFSIDAIFSGAYTVVMDFLLALLPWFLLWKLNMKRKERLTISVGLSLGVFAGIFGIARAILLANTANLADYTYATVNIMILGGTELLVCMICATLPGLRPLYSKIRGVGSSSDKTSQGINYAYPSRGYDELDKSQADIKMSTFKKYQTTTTTATAGAYTGPKAPGKQFEDDSASDEHRLVQGQAPLAIMATTEVNVTYTMDGESSRKTGPAGFQNHFG